MAEDSEGGGEPPLIIKDIRKRDAASGVPITDKNRKDATVNPVLARRIVREAKFQGVDPYTALAVAYQETNLGVRDMDDSFHVLDPDFTDLNDDFIHTGVKALKNKMKYGKDLGKKDEASILQAFNGYGKIGNKTEGNQTKFYGIDVSKSPLDLSKNPVYGKRIIDLRDNILKAHPEIVKLVDSEQGNDPSLSAPYKKPDAYKQLSIKQRSDWNDFLDYVNKQKGF